MAWKFTSISFWKEEDLWAKEASKRRPEAQKGVAHAATVPGRVGPTLLALVAPLPSIFRPPTPSWPKNAYKKGPLAFRERRRRRNTKPRNRETEGCRRRRSEGGNAAGIASGGLHPPPACSSSTSTARTSPPSSPWWRGSSPPPGLGFVVVTFVSLLSLELH